jgi:hypothetical protein
MPRKKNPPAGSHGGEASVSLADVETSNKSRPYSQPLDDLARLRTLYLIQHFSVQPETAAALALLAFGGAG